MISPEMMVKIRRLFHAEHWKVGTIATELGVHPDAVKRALNTQNFEPKTRPIRPTLLDPYKEFIAETLEQYPRIRSTRLYEMLKSRGYSGSVISLRRYVRTVRPKSRTEAYLRLETLPGEQGQVDWGHFGKLEVGAAKRALSCFVMVLSYSRAMYARFFLDQTMESFLRGHIEAFEAFGGVPRILLYDNLKSVVIERDGELFRLHPRILDMCGHYHCKPQPCAPYRGNEKGKVERTIRYLRDSFFHARRFHTLSELNDQLRAWVRDIAHQRPVPGAPHKRPVHEVLDEERSVLLPVPEHPFSADLVLPVRSGKTPYIRFDCNDYSIPHTAIRQPLTLVASETRVRILDATQTVIATHSRAYESSRRIEDPAHIAALARHKHAARASTGRQRIIQACPHAQDFFAQLCARDKPLASNTARLGRLLDVYGAEKLDEALQRALQRGAISAASVAHLVDQIERERRTPDERPALTPVLSQDPRVQNLRLTPHSLTNYDELAHEHEEDQHGDHS